MPAINKYQPAQKSVNPSTIRSIEPKLLQSCGLIYTQPNWKENSLDWLVESALRLTA